MLSEFPQLEENAKHYAEIAKMLSKLGSVMLLDCMTENDIEEYIYKKFKTIAEEEIANDGVFKRFKNTVVSVLRN